MWAVTWIDRDGTERAEYCVTREDARRTRNLLLRWRQDDIIARGALPSEATPRNIKIKRGSNE